MPSRPPLPTNTESTSILITRLLTLSILGVLVLTLACASEHARQSAEVRSAVAALSAQHTAKRRHQVVHHLRIGRKVIRPTRHSPSSPKQLGHVGVVHNVAETRAAVRQILSQVLHHGVGCHRLEEVAQTRLLALLTLLTLLTLLGLRRLRGQMLLQRREQGRQVGVGRVDNQTRLARSHRIFVAPELRVHGGQSRVRLHVAGIQRQGLLAVYS